VHTRLSIYPFFGQGLDCLGFHKHLCWRTDPWVAKPVHSHAPFHVNFVCQGHICLCMPHSFVWNYKHHCFEHISGFFGSECCTLIESIGRVGSWVLQTTFGAVKEIFFQTQGLVPSVKIYITRAGMYNTPHTCAMVLSQWHSCLVRQAIDRYPTAFHWPKPSL